VAPLPRPRRHRAARSHRRAARRRPPSRCSWPTGPTRCSRPCLLTYGGPGAPSRSPSSPPTRCTPHRPAHRHPRRRGRAGRRLLPRPRRGAPRHRRARRPSPTCARPTTRPAWSRPAIRPWLEVLVTGSPACSWSTRRTASSPRGRRSSSSTTTPRSWSPAPSPRPGRWRRPARLLVGPSWVVAELEKVVLPYHLDALKQIAGTIALDYRRRDGAAGGGCWSRSAAGSTPRCASCPRGLAVGRQLHPLPAPSPPTADEVWQRSSTARCSCATARRGPPRRLPARHHRHPEETTASSPPWPRGPHMRKPRTATSQASAPPRRRHLASRRSTSTDRPGTVSRRDRAAVLRPHARPARPPRRVRPDRRARATSTSTATTPSRTRASCWARRSGRRWATRPASGGSRRACSRWTRR
jgi:hypothetical protein